jgi:hypothetical protein
MLKLCLLLLGYRRGEGYLHISLVAVPATKFLLALLLALFLTCGYTTRAVMPGGLHPPTYVTAAWTPNFINPETRGCGIVVLVAVLLALTYLVVFMRLWARVRLSKNAGIDDALIAFNIVSCCLLFIHMLYQ